MKHQRSVDTQSRAKFLATPCADLRADVGVFQPPRTGSGEKRTYAIGATGSGNIAIDNRDIVGVTTKLGQTSSAKGEAIIPNGSPGAAMVIHVSSIVSQFGAFRGILHIRYVWVAGPPPTPTPGSLNLALNRPAKQSSTSQWSHPDDAQGAVDGNVSGGYGFHTASEPTPWWQVDLGAVRALTEIRIFNRRDCCSERARTLQVLLSNDGASHGGGCSATPAPSLGPTDRPCEFRSKAFPRGSYGCNWPRPIIFTWTRSRYTALGRREWARLRPIRSGLSCRRRLLSLPPSRR